MSTPAGWYDDGSGRQRWWDGTQWTEHFAPEAPSEQTPAETAEPTPETSSAPVDGTPDAPAADVPSGDAAVADVPPADISAADVPAAVPVADVSTPDIPSADATAAGIPAADIAAPETPASETPGYAETAGYAAPEASAPPVPEAPAAPESSPYAAPGTDSSAYAAPAYGGSAYAPPADANAPGYGAPQYGAPQYGAPQYGAPQYGTGYGAPAPEKKSPSVIGWIALGVSALGLILGCIPPVVMMFGWGLLFAGLVLSVIALFMKGAKWPGIVGIILAVIGAFISAVIGLIWLGITVTSHAIDNAKPDPMPSSSQIAEEPSPDPSPDGESAGRPSPDEIAAGFLIVMHDAGFTQYDDPTVSACIGQFFYDSDVSDESLQTIAGGKDIYDSEMAKVQQTTRDAIQECTN